MNFRLLFPLLIILNIRAAAQPPTAFPIKNAIVDDSLTLADSLTFPSQITFDAPRYIVNRDYIIYQRSPVSREILKADAASFRLVDEFYWRHTFALDKAGVYFRGHFIAADTTGFEVVGGLRYTAEDDETGIFWKTATRLFRDTTEITGDIDVPTFRVAYSMPAYYFLDKRFIYFRDKKISGSDASTASEPTDVTISNPAAGTETTRELIYDKRYVYINGQIALHGRDTLRPVNNYLMRAGNVVLSRSRQQVVPGIDAKTLRRLSDDYAVDKSHLYWGAEKTPLPTASLKSVKVWDQLTSRYYSDGKRIYSGINQPEPEYDAATFGMIPGSDFTFDKDGVYYRKPDDNLGRYIRVKMPFRYAGPVTAEQLFYRPRSLYIVYRNQAYDYYREKLFTDLGPAQVAMVKEGTTDIAEQDSSGRRKVLDQSLYELDGKVYWNGLETIADAATFGRFKYGYRDKAHVYAYTLKEGLRPLEGVDGASAALFQDFMIDRNFLYIGDNRVLKSEAPELLAVFAGYRPGCGMDRTPSSDYYLFKNAEGYWIVRSSADVRVRKLGKVLPEEYQRLLERR